MKSPAKRYLLVYFMALLLFFIVLLLPAFISLPSLTWSDLDAINYEGLNNGPPDKNWYLCTDIMGYLLEHDVFYYNFGRSIENAKKADILFIGSSRVQYGFDWNLMRSFTERHSLRFFSMAFGGESGEFPLMIIQKYDLRPKIVIVNAEDLGGHLSNFARHIIAQGRFGSVFSFFLRNAISKDVLILQSYAPNWFRKMLPSLFNKTRGTYRSRITGEWFRGLLPEKSVPIKYTIEFNCWKYTGVEELKNANRFKDKMSERGAQLVLTLIPNIYICRKGAENLAQHIGTPFIWVDWQGMNTLDGTHLTQESSKRFTEEFLREFEKSETFLNRVSKKTVGGIGP
jgi:hypothetical protein